MVSEGGNAMKPRVAVILGPTATGKSHCGIALAKRLNGEIISGDSMLVYQRMDIGTAKPSAEELAAVPHHLIDILPPDAAFSVVDFKEKAEKIIADINSRGKLPVIVGGTGLYIKALLENYEFNTVEGCSELRSELEAFAEEHGNSALYEKLQALDLEAASRLHTNDRRRIIRVHHEYIQQCQYPAYFSLPLNQQLYFQYYMLSLLQLYMDLALHKILTYLY